MSKKPYEEGSIADLAVRGFSKILTLSKSSHISDKLSAINMLLWVLTLGIIISFFLGSYLTEMFAFIIIFGISLLFSCISLLFYAPILEVIMNLSQNKIEGLRISIIILFIDLTIVLAGLLFGNDFLIKISLGVLGLQLILILLVSFLVSFTATPEGPVKDKKVKPSQIWDFLGRVAIIVGLISFIIDIVLILIKV